MDRGVMFMAFVRHHWLLLLTLAALMAFIGVHVVWYIRPSSIDTPQELHTQITSGQPTVVEYYTNL